MKTNGAWPAVRAGAVVIAASLLSHGASAQCRGWLPGHGLSPTGGTFKAVTLFDPDGPGPAREELIVGGDFTEIGGTFMPLIARLARWDGVAWRSVLDLTHGVNSVEALAVFDLDGPGPDPARLIVGGNFHIGADPERIHNVFWSDGSSIARLSDGLSGTVRALHVFDPDGDGPAPPTLYAGGAFTSSGSRAVNRVVQWVGEGWESVGASIAGDVNVLTSIDLDADGPMPPMLVAGTTDGVRFFDGKSWIMIGGSPMGEVTSLDVFDFDGPGGDPPRLVAAGRFQVDTRNFSLRGQAVFNGQTWEPIAPVNLFSIGRTIGAFDPDGPGPIEGKLYLSGTFTPAGQSRGSRLAVFTDGGWVSIAGDEYNGDINVMKSFVLPGDSSASLLIAGNFWRQVPHEEYHLATLRDGVLAPYPDGFDDVISHLFPARLLGEPTVIACGTFTRAPGVAAHGVAAFDGEAWSGLRPGATTGAVIAGAAFDPDGSGPLSERIVVGGFFEAIGGVAARHVAMFDGAAWAPMGDGMRAVPRAFGAFDPDGPGPSPARLFASGGQASNDPGSGGVILEWTGSAWVERWQVVAGGGRGTPEKMTTFDPDGDGPEPRQLVVVGMFDHIDGVSARNIAAYDGTAWRPLGSGLSVNCQAVFAWDRHNDGREVIVVGGAFTSAGGTPAIGAAVWDGNAWSALGDGFGSFLPGVPDFPYDYCVFDGALHATGNFSIAAGGPGDGIARWNGKSWEPLAPGLSDGTTPAGGRSLAVLHSARGPIMCVAGYFQSAGGLANAYFASFGSTCCPADYDGDGMVTSADAFAFFVDFLNEHDRADFNADGAVTSQDLFDFLAQFFTGCE